MLVVQRLGSGPQSMDKFYSHKAHKQQAMVPKADKDMGVLLARGDLTWGHLSIILLHWPKASSRPSMRDATLVFQCTQLYFLWGFQSFGGIYIALFTLPCHHAGLDLDWEATTQTTSPSPWLVQIQQEGWVPCACCEIPALCKPIWTSALDRSRFYTLVTCNMENTMQIAGVFAKLREAGHRSRSAIAFRGILENRRITECSELKKSH